MRHNDTPASTVDVAYTFMGIPADHILGYNWRCAPREHQGLWDVNDETYINGVALTIDGDYWMGYLIEIVERTSGVVSYMAINLYHGRRDDGTFDHDFMTYPHNCGTFFERTDEAEKSTVGCWAVTTIYGMAEGYFSS